MEHSTSLRISRDRDKFSSIPVISSEIRIAFSSIRQRCAVKVWKSPRDPNNDQGTERNQTRQFSQVSRDLMNDYSDDYRVPVRRTDDLQFPFERALGCTCVHTEGSRFFTRYEDTSELFASNWPSSTAICASTIP